METLDMTDNTDIFPAMETSEHRTMENLGPKIIMLGTGSAAVTRCYNTCFLLLDRGEAILVDAGGGNGILPRLEQAGHPASGIRNMFLTHAHTDHILGAVWVTRIVMQEMLKGRYEGTFNIFGHDKSLMVLSTICRMTLQKKYSDLIGEKVLLHEVHDGEIVSAGNFRLECFDILSTKEKQFGFRTVLSDGQSLVCLGDEPFNPADRKYAEGADWMMCEAFCLYADRDRFKPYEKNHSTALDAGRLAQELNVRNLVLYHTEDTALEQRKSRYTEEAAKCFSGRIFVPDDLETIDLG